MRERVCAGRGIWVVVVAGSLLVGCSDCETGVPPGDAAADIVDAGGGGEVGSVDAGESGDVGAVGDVGKASDVGGDAASDAGGGGDVGGDIADVGDGGVEAGGDVRDADDGGGGEAVCGDGVVEGDEACDDGNTESGDYCAADCSEVTGECGDGELQENESCDDGEIASGCDSAHDGGDGTCQPPGECSDGYFLDDGECLAEQREAHVHVYISNTCELSVSPAQVEVPPGQTVSFTYHNHSSDYAADVWLSYIGGYTDLQQGATWDDSFEHCASAGRPYDQYADISIAGFDRQDPNCPGHRMDIVCQ